eukprot:scaffold217420_cov47-Prasinocladus_malaysianus.AAC.1
MAGAICRAQTEAKAAEGKARADSDIAAYFRHQRLLDQEKATVSSQDSEAAKALQEDIETF